MLPVGAAKSRSSRVIVLVTTYPMDLLQNSIRFVKTNEEGGYVNVHTRDIEYRPDNTVKVVVDPTH